MDKLLRGSWARRMVNRLYHLLHANTRRGSRRNIAAHYDLGNDFYRLWLDQSMTYSAAIFESMDEPLVAAQERKYQRLAEKIGLCDGDSVLEIGCGWGGFAEYAARHFDCTILCLTLSQEQADFATARIKDAGLEKQVEIRIQDYRDVGGEFDKIVSIEMFEAVGEANWPTYFDTVRQRLKADGKAGIQTITIADSAFAGYRKNTDFIQRYIFPGGMLANPTRFIAIADRLGLQNDDSFFFGDSYAETMRRWDHGFRAAWPKIAALGFDDRFYRMWRYYMCYCEAGFVHGHIDVGQFVLTRK
jgi:cyclopropane-fatty-acyl-phospholipid synthase